MKKLLIVSGIFLAVMTACNDNSTTGTTTIDTSKATEGKSREKEISDSTKMLDKKLADPKSTYSPDSLK